MSEEFVSELIKPVTETFDPARMSRGEPGLPDRFIWKDKEYTIAEILQTWQELGPCKSGGPARIKFYMTKKSQTD
jgi:hypothetical protein